MTNEECFQTAIRIETLFRDVYASLAEAYADSPPLRDMFNRLAEEEEQHAQRILILSRHRADAQWSDDALARIARDLDSVSTALMLVATDFRSADGRPDAADVLQRVIDLEHRCGSLHAESLARCLDPEVQGFFHALSRQDEHHRELLESALS
ncbi:MAG: ferritin family protein [Anaeromyxobacteraceae bacterium]